MQKAFFATTDTDKRGNANKDFERRANQAQRRECERTMQQIIQPHDNSRKSSSFVCHCCLNRFYTVDLSPDQTPLLDNGAVKCRPCHRARKPIKYKAMQTAISAAGQVTLF